MNTATKMSTAVVLGLSLMGASLGADAASVASHARLSQDGTPSYGKVLELGTIQVTPADVDGAPAARPRHGGTVYLGEVDVTPDASPEARAAATAAGKQGTLFLGSITVTPNDSTEARYAANQAETSGTVFLGSVQVTPKDAKAPVLAGFAAVLRSLGPKVLFAVLGALAFARVGG